MTYYVIDAETGDIRYVVMSYDEAERRALHLQRIRAEQGMYFEYEIINQKEFLSEQYQEPEAVESTIEMPVSREYELLKSKWKEVLELVVRNYNVSKITFSVFLEPLSLKTVEDKVAFIVVPNGQIGINILEKKYTLPLRVAIEEVTGLSLEIKYLKED